MRVTTAEDITKMFMKFDGQLDYSDTPSSFYSSLQGVFATLAREEALACEWEGLDMVEYPLFGSSVDTYDNTVKVFYAIWTSFATKKTFSWKDVFHYSEAPDRRVRRMMEKENKRFREEGIKEFNEAVRALVVFVKKRDPRYTPNRQSEAERQNVLRDKAAAQAARSRAANEAKLKRDAVPHWASLSPPEKAQTNDEEAEEEELEPQQQFECVICRKSFKSEKQWEAHEKSKKHVKAVQQLRRTMQEENAFLGPDQSENVYYPLPKAPSEEEEARAQLKPLGANLGDEDIPIDIDCKQSIAFANNTLSDPNEIDGLMASMPLSESGDEYTSRQQMEDRILGNTAIEGSAAADALHSTTNTSNVNQAYEHLLMKKDEAINSPKMGKAKEKWVRREAQKTSTATEGNSDHECAYCQAGFPSKTRLFNHIKDFGHAASVAKTAQGKKGKKR